MNLDFDLDSDFYLDSNSDLNSDSCGDLDNFSRSTCMCFEWNLLEGYTVVNLFVRLECLNDITLVHATESS